MTKIEGQITVDSPLDAEPTLHWLETVLAAKGVQIFARINHAAGASGAGMDLRPTTVLIFGNAKAGTPLMQANRAIGIDLPLKILVWEDDAGKTQMTTNDVEWLARRHAVSERLFPIVQKMKHALGEVLRSAAQA